MKIRGITDKELENTDNVETVNKQIKNLRHGREHIWIILYTLQYIEEIIENLFESSFNNLIAGRYHNLETKMCSIVKKNIEDLCSVCACEINKQHDCGEHYYNILTRSYKVKSVPFTGTFYSVDFTSALKG